MEYPGYGVYKDRKCSEKKILEDADSVFHFATKKLSFLSKNIIVVGRSLGSGPATFLASKNLLRSLVLISPFTTMKKIVKDHVSFLSFMFKERFNNLKRIKKMTSPLFIVHGEKDRLISKKHSVKLIENCSSRFKQLEVSDEMTHNKFILY